MYHTATLPTTTYYKRIPGIGSGVFHNGCESAIKVNIDSTWYDFDNWFNTKKGYRELRSNVNGRSNILADLSRQGELKYLTLYRNPLPYWVYDTLCDNYNITVNRVNVPIGASGKVYTSLKTGIDQMLTSGHPNVNNRLSAYVTEQLNETLQTNLYGWTGVIGNDSTTAIISLSQPKTIAEASVSANSTLNMYNNCWIRL